MKMIICSDQEIEIGIEGEGEMYSPFKDAYVEGTFKFLRLATVEEYYQYIARYNLSTKGLRLTRFYYEIETDVVFI